MDTAHMVCDPVTGAPDQVHDWRCDCGKTWRPYAIPHPRIGEIVLCSPACTKEHIAWAKVTGAS